MVVVMLKDQSKFLLRSDWLIDFFCLLVCIVTGNNSHHEEVDRHNLQLKEEGLRGSGQHRFRPISLNKRQREVTDASMATPASDSTFLQQHHLDIHGDDASSQGAVVGSVIYNSLLFLFDYSKYLVGFLCHFGCDCYGNF